MIYVYNENICKRIILSLKIKEHHVIHDNMDETEKHYAKWNKPNVET